MHIIIPKLQSWIEELYPVVGYLAPTDINPKAADPIVVDSVPIKRKKG